MGDTNRSPALNDYQRGADAFKAGRIEEAVTHFKRAGEVDPKFYRSWAYLGMAYARINKIDEAIEAYRKCIDIAPDYHKAYNNIGELYRRKGLLDYAAMVFKMATEIDANHAHYFYNLGITYSEIGMLPQAEGALASAVALDGDDFDFVSELAQVRFSLRKFADAASVLGAFLEKHPGHDRASEVNARVTMLKRRVEAEAQAAAQISQHKTETRLAAIEETDPGVDDEQTKPLPPSDENP